MLDYSRISLIIFDCFNTLLDDFDASGDETGMPPIASIPVSYGLYHSEQAFVEAYVAWRKRYWSNGHTTELTLDLRLQQLLSERVLQLDGTIDVNTVVSQMMHQFDVKYPDILRLTPDVESILVLLKDKYRLSVLSNFPLPGYPEKMLKSFGLSQYFERIMDSAQVGVKKPNRAIYNRLLEALRIGKKDRSNVLFVGDNLVNDVKMPSTLGLQSLYFDRSDDRPGVISTCEYPSFRRWNQLPEILEL